MSIQDELENIYKELKIGNEELVNNKLPRCDQLSLSMLEVIAIDFEGKPILLEKTAALAWRLMNESAQSDGVLLEAFSGFRSYLYQGQLFKRRFAKGQLLHEILLIAAIPGFSEHHSGCAIDICTDGKYQLEESFENTVAFNWLIKNAKRFGFSLSYPRNNDKGIIYEPWHWLYCERSLS